MNITLPREVLEQAVTDIICGNTEYAIKSLRTALAAPAAREPYDSIVAALKRGGAALPAPEVTGTMQGAVTSGLCIALAIVENEMAARGIGKEQK